MKKEIYHKKYSEILLLLKTKYGWTIPFSTLTENGRNLVHDTLSAQIDVSYEKKEMSFIQKVVFGLFFKGCVIFKKDGI